MPNHGQDHDMTVMVVVMMLATMMLAAMMVTSDCR